MFFVIEKTNYMYKVILILLVLGSSNLFGQGNTSAEKMKASASINDFVANKSLLSFKVLSYTVYYQAKQKDPIVMTNNGAAFTPEVKKVIQMAKAGDIYYIEDIKVLGPDNITRKIPGIAFKIQ